MTRAKFSKKVLSVILSICIIIACLPFSLLSASAATPNSISTFSDPSTMDDWKNYFITGDVIDTVNAGGVWTDKSVFNYSNATANAELNGLGLVPSENGFISALSVIASNMVITGSSTVPTDTMLVLDVSGSMDGRESDLVNATNAAIAALSENPNSRVGVILYSGTSSRYNDNSNAAVVLLPLGSYTTGVDGVYIREGTGWDDDIILDESVVYRGTNTKPNSTSKDVTGATYIQKGVILAKNQFTADTNVITPSENRKPVIVLMSDGAPTLASTDFTAPGQYNMGDGGTPTSQIAFVTQLSVAYAKQQVEAKYKTKALFYTLGLGTSGDAIATNVLNPNNTLNDSNSNAIKVLWSTYNTSKVNSFITVTDNRSVKKVQEPLEQFYVNRYFTAAQSGDLIDVFESIVSEIALQSKYYPTFVTEDEDLSGYVSFVDKIGKYMNVTSVRGFVIGGELYSGAEMAKSFNEGILGTVENPSTLGDEVIYALRARLGISGEQARNLVAIAYQHGQLKYNSATDYSNYIGWYANSSGQYLGPWYEGITTMPDATDTTIPEEARPFYIVKSYGYLGAVDAEHGVAASDMMYATVQVREEIVSGEQMVSFAIPASLIPTVTYNVTLNDNGDLTELTTSGATSPIRLVYEVALDSDINEWNVSEKVDDEYLAANTVGGKVNFYTNKYEVDNTTGYGTVNTYSYFRPSMSNDRYYFKNDSRIYYLDGNEYLPYTVETTHPKDANGTFYRKHAVYVNDNSRLNTRIDYSQLSTAILEDAKYVEDEWIIEGGHVRLNYGNYDVLKNPNTTGTLIYANQPFIDYGDPNQSSAEHEYVVGATLGNNGKLSLTAQSGIKISKTLGQDATATTKSFNFKITTATTDNSTYNAYIVHADGIGTDTTVTFTNGIEYVSLKPGESVYIGGLTEGAGFKVEEVTDFEYKVESVNVNGVVSNTNTPTLIVVASDMQSAEFINTDRGTGNFTVSKQVVHPFGGEYTAHTAKEFVMDVTLTIDGVPLANQSYNNGAYITDADGKIVDGITLKHNEQVEIFGLPGGTEVYVVEQNSENSGFTPKYYDNGAVGDGIVEIEANKTSSVIVRNEYTPDDVTASGITLTAEKVLQGRDWQAGDSFEFQFQEWDGTDWVTLDTAIVTNATSKTFNFTDIIKAENYTEAGEYYYRITEKEPESPLAGVDYDKAVHAFYVVVTDNDMDGALEISDVVSQNTATTTVDGSATTGWDISIDFTNIYEAEAVNATIEIQKSIYNTSNSTLAKLEGFRFEIYNYSPTTGIGTKLPEFAATSITGLTKTTIRFEGVASKGTYHYAIKEVNDGKAGWKYSTKTAYVTVKIDDDGAGRLVATAYEGLGTNAPVNANHTVTVGFENTYSLTPAKVELDFVNKKLIGRDYEAGEFRFEIKGHTYNLLDSEYNAISTNTITGTNTAPDANGDSKVIFTQPLYFDKVGTYAHNITEVQGDKGGVTYDTNVGRVNVTVFDKGDGTLGATYVVMNVEGNEVNFVNTYNVNPVSKAVEAEKKLNNLELTNEKFAFIMQEATDNDGTVKTGGTSYTARNTAYGKILFPDITYNTAGTYYYVISEQDGGQTINGIKYDNKRWAVAITVIDNLDGDLIVEETVYTLIGEGVEDKIVFENTYTPNPIDVPITGTKLLGYAEGILAERKLKANEFEFTLYNSNEDWNTGKEIETVSNNADGKFAFGDIPITAAGSYYYLVKEVKAGQTIDGVTYDTAVFRVRIDVTDNGRGTLTPMLYFCIEDIPYGSIAFENIYNITGVANVTVGGNKTLTGRDLVDGEFTFELYETDDTFSIEDLTPQTQVNSNGKYNFALEYGAEDVGNTFYYVVKEKNAGQVINSVTYSDMVYKVTISVEDNLLGGIKTVVTVNDSISILKDELNFTNKYQDNTPSTPQIPQTGDASNILLWCIMLITSGCALFAIYFYGRKKKEDN